MREHARLFLGCVLGHQAKSRSCFGCLCNEQPIRKRSDSHPVAFPAGTAMASRWWRSAAATAASVACCCSCWRQAPSSGSSRAAAPATACPWVRAPCGCCLQHHAWSVKSCIVLPRAALYVTDAHACDTRSSWQYSGRACQVGQTGVHIQFPLSFRPTARHARMAGGWL